MDLATIRHRCLEQFHAMQVPGMPFGCVRPRRGAAPDFYASADWAIIRTIWGEDLRQTLPTAQREQWIAHLAAQVTPGDGSFTPLVGHSKLHANGTAIGAFGALGGRLPAPVRLYEPFADPARVGSWLENAIDWRAQWSASHLFWGGMHCFALSSGATPAWRAAVFTWLDAEADPQTGWWRRGTECADRNQPLGGAAHILPIYQHLGRRFPYPERLIDSVLALQLTNGAWLGECTWQTIPGCTYLDLDALYALDLACTWVPGYRTADILAATRRHAQLITPIISDELINAFSRHPHRILELIGTLGLAQRFAPEEFRDDRVWTDIFSDRALYRVRESEAAACAAALP